MRKIGIVVLAVLSSAVFAQTLTYAIVDTDVMEFYSDDAIISEPGEGQAFYGQDANYDGNQPSYTDHEDGTVSDNVTGLMWQQDPGEKMSYADAVALAKTMDLGGHSDWRIPTIKELYSLAYFSGRCFGEDVIDKFIDDNFVQLIGDESLGEREIDAQTWSSTHYVGLTMSGDTTIFGFNFVDGRLKGYPKYAPKDGSAKTMYFRMVRGNEQYGINDFRDNGNGTITDNATGLMWQQADNGTTYDWEDGLEYAESLVLGGHSDWRMPNAKELQSIVDYTRSPATSSSPAIDPLFSCTEITDPEGVTGQYGYYWTSSPLKDGSNPYSDAVYICFGKAQGQMEVPTGSGNYFLWDVHGAGAQRNDPKSGNASDYPAYHGPQGDVVYVYNYVRCVRDAGVTSSGARAVDAEVKVYPNPASTYITISGGELYGIQVCDLSGKLVFRSEMESRVERIDIAGLNSGVYFVQLSGDGGVMNRKIIKE